MTHRVFAWDWRGQLNLDRLGRAVTELSEGRLHLYQVDTGSDEYAIVLSDRPLTAGDVTAAYNGDT